MSDEPNEIVAAAAAAKAHKDAGAPKAAAAQRASHWPLTRIGLGVGIGSAAVAAAVLYARGRRED